MPKGRKGKPEAILKLEGNYREDRHGGNITERSPEADLTLIDPPQEWPEPAKAIFNKSASMLSEMNLLYKTDVILLERYAWAVFMARLAEAEMSGNGKPSGQQIVELQQFTSGAKKKASEWFSIWRHSTDTVRQIGSLFGFSPADKMKIRLPDTSKDDWEQNYDKWTD